MAQVSSSYNQNAQQLNFAYQTQSQIDMNSSLITLSPQNNGSRIKVAVRVRPLLEHEKSQGHACQLLKVQNQHEISIAADEQTGQRQKTYRFDKVFTQDSLQSDMYNGLGISNLVSKVIEGYHGTIFAYGQTGSGKTFTMEGYDFVSNSSQSPDGPLKTVRAVKASNDSENVGITQRSIFELFKQVEELKKQERSRHYSVFCSFLQIYNEKVFDLLNSSSIQSLGSKKVAGNQDAQKQQQGLRIRWTKKDQFVVENLFVFECGSPEEAIDLFKFGSKNRILASHNLNDMSSRSHTIFCLTVESQDMKHQDTVTVSKLQLVDLAGSEKQSLTGTTGQQAKESIDINKSLLVLRKVITALTETKTQEGFIPYRESKLTCLLKQSLGGNSYTLMIACLSPSDRYLEENLSTLNYAAKASLISNIPTKNIDPRLMEINDQKKKIIELEKELKSANEHIQFITQMNDEKSQKIMQLESQIKQMSGRQEAGLSTGISTLPHINMRALKSEIPKDDLNSIMAPEASSGKSSQLGKDFEGLVGSPSKSQPRGDKISSDPKTQSILQSQQARRQTQMNFFIQKDKEKQDAAAERLIHSVNAVTALLKANTELRDTIEKLKAHKENQEGEVFGLQIENQTLRERLEVVEGILKSNKEDYENLVSDNVKNNMMKSNTQYGKFNMNAPLDESSRVSIDAVYNELIQLRQKNRVLEGRIKQLETQNFRMTKMQFAEVKNKTQKNMEPNRPIFESNTISATGTPEPEQAEEDYDQEDDEEDVHEQDYPLLPPGQSAKSRSFIVTIDEHKPLQKKLKPKSQLRQYSKGSQKGGEPYQQKISMPSHSNQISQSKERLQSNEPDQRYYTKTKFFSVTDDLKKTLKNDYGQLQDFEVNIRGDGGAVQPPLIPKYSTPHQSDMNKSYYESDFNVVSDNTQRKNKMMLQPISEQVRQGTDVDFKLYQQQLLKHKKKKFVQEDNNISMVMVMSNLMTKRSNQAVAKKKNNTTSQKRPPRQNQNDFYF